MDPVEEKTKQSHSSGNDKLKAIEKPEVALHLKEANPKDVGRGIILTETC